MPNIETPTETKQPEVELHFFRDADLKVSGFMVSIPDSVCEGMQGGDLTKIAPTFWNSGRDKAHRIMLLSQAVQQIEAHRQAKGQVCEPSKPASRSERFAKAFVGLLKGGRK